MKDMSTRVPAKWMKRVTVAAVLAIIMVPTAVIAAGGAFVDDDTSIFENDINWMADSGVTTGCDPAAQLFCPEDNVTRGQMAAFMRRFSQYLDAEDGTPAEADNATTLAGQAATAYVTSINGYSCDSTCPDVAVTNVEMIELAVTAPADGYLFLSGDLMAGLTGPTDDYVSMWFTLNGDSTSFNGCEGSFLGIPIGSHALANIWKWNWLDGAVDYAVLSATGVIEVPAGNHTVRLCSFSNVAGDTTNASLSAIWSAEGSATVAGTGGVEITPELQGMVEAAQD